METANEEAARRFAEAITSGDTEAAVAICDPEIVFDSVLGITGRPYRGHAGIRQYIADVKSAWAQWSVEVEDVVEGADGRVAITMTMHARGKESGALLHERAAHIWTLRDRRLVGNRPYRDPDNALRALGLASPRGRRGS